VFELIKRFSELTGPTAEEEPVLSAADQIWRNAGLATERSAVGNLIGRVGSGGRRVLLVAHADELCYLVRSIDSHGYLWLANGQAWSRTLNSRDWFTVGQRVRVLARSGELPGVIASVTGHVASLRLPEPREMTWDDLWVDTGLTRVELLALGVTPGTRVIWDATCERIGAQFMGKALDDRGGVAVLCEVVQRVASAQLNCSLTVACSVQEEIGVAGADALGAREQWDAAIVVESGLAGDVPRVGELALPIRLGGGPILVHKDSLVHYHHGLTAELEHLAGTIGMPLQHAVFGSFGSDGSALMKSGTPAALLAFPTRYTHTPFEMGNMRDIEGMVHLLVAFVTGVPDEKVTA